MPCQTLDLLHCNHPIWVLPNMKNTSQLDVGLRSSNQDRPSCPPCIFEYPRHRRSTHRLLANNHDACCSNGPATPGSAIALLPTRPILLPSLLQIAPSLCCFMLSIRTKALSAILPDRGLPAKAMSAVLPDQRLPVEGLYPR